MNANKILFKDRLTWVGCCFRCCKCVSPPMAQSMLVSWVLGLREEKGGVYIFKDIYPMENKGGATPQPVLRF